MHSAPPTPYLGDSKWKLRTPSAPHCAALPASTHGPASGWLPQNTAPNVTSDLPACLPHRPLANQKHSPADSAADLVREIRGLPDAALAAPPPAVPIPPTRPAAYAHSPSNPAAEEA